LRERGDPKSGARRELGGQEERPCLKRTSPAGPAGLNGGDQRRGGCGEQKTSEEKAGGPKRRDTGSRRDRRKKKEAWGRPRRPEGKGGTLALRTNVGQAQLDC